MINFKFDKAIAERVLDALATGKPIAPLDQSGWTRDGMLMLAGALYFGALSHGPTAPPGEATSEREFFQDLDDAIDFYSKLTTLVADGEYDASGFEPHCRAIIQRHGGTKTVGVLVGMPPPGSAFWAGADTKVVN